MKKIALLLSILMILTVAFASCGGNESGGISGGGNDTSDSSSGTRTVTGLDGSTIELPSNITKAVSLSPSVTLVISELGADSKLVGVDSDSASLSTPPSASKVDVAGVAALSPEVVFAPADLDVSSIESAGIPVVKIPYAASIAEIKDMIRLTGKIFDSTDKAETMITSVTNALNVVQSIATTKYSLFLDLGDLNTTGSGTYLNEMISAAGGANIFADKEGLITTTDDEVIAANPAFIFTTGSVDAIKNRAGWENIDAVVNGQVYQLPSSEVVYPSQNITTSVQFIYETIMEVKG